MWGRAPTTVRERDQVNEWQEFDCFELFWDQPQIYFYLACPLGQPWMSSFRDCSIFPSHQWWLHLREHLNFRWLLKVSCRDSNPFLRTERIMRKILKSKILFQYFKKLSGLEGMSVLEQFGHESVSIVYLIECGS